MKKYRLFFDPRKEENWLNSIEGYRLVKVGILSYTFDKDTKRYEYSLNYTPGNIEYLKLLNNMKDSSFLIKRKIGWTYIGKEKRVKSFYRKEERNKESLKLFVNKYKLYSKAFFMFGLAFFTLFISINKYFIICSILMFILSMLYKMCIKTTQSLI